MTNEQAMAEGTPQSLIETGRIGFRGAGKSLEDRSHVLDALYFEGERRVPYLWRFFTLIVMSSAIAAFGLANDSAAVVIGAMLIAPLMTPIMAFAAALVQAWGRRQLESLLIVVGGAAVAVAVGWLITSVLPRFDPGAVVPAEILARTNPNLVDLAIAVVAGAAGAYVTVRSEAGSALPGVGIAVALIPPLASYGMLLGADQTALASGALLLFLTNFAAITLSAGITFAIAGFVPPPERIRHGWFGFAAAVFFVLLLAAPLLANTIPNFERSSYAAEAVRVVEAWDPMLEVESVVVDATQASAEFEIVVSGSEPPRDVERLATDLAEQIDRSVDLQLLYTPSAFATADP